MISIAICDDDKIFADSLSKAIKIGFENANIECSVRSFHCVQDFYQAVTDKYYDLLFLDIEIGKDSGIDLANRVRDELNNHKSLIVFVSSHKGYHNEGQLYSAAPIRFISKPLNAGEIDHVVEIVMKRLLKPAAPDDYFSYTFKLDKHMLLKKDIYYFESELRNIIAVTKDNRVSFISTMDEVRRQAVEPYFVQIHRSFLVNILHLESYDVKYVHMKNGAVLPISTRQRKDAMWAIVDFFDRKAREDSHEYRD